MTGDHSRPGDAWTAYWRAGRGASCFEGSAAEVRLAGLWNELVDALPDGARLLDLATGNGTVVRSCVARARTRNVSLEIDAVDAAAIDPRASLADPEELLRGVRFHGGTRLEALPFADASFDAIVSQFGFEYAEEAAAAAEAVRCLAPAGRLRLVLHARDGAVTRDIGGRLARLRSVLAGQGAVSLVVKLARAAAAGDAATLERESAHLPAAARQVRSLARRPPPDDAALFYSAEFLKLWAERGKYRPADLLRSVEDGWRNATGVAMRQEQMQAAARSAEQVAGIAGRFRAAGLEVDEARPVRDERRGVRIAWLLDARKT